MNITLIGFLLGMLLLALPLAAMYRYGLRISAGRAMSAIVRMVIYVGIMGFVMYMLQKDGSVAMSLLFVLALIVLASVVAILRSHLSLRVLFIPVVAAVAASVIVVGAWLLLVTLGTDAVVSPRFFLPVVGILSGTAITVCADSLSAYYDGLKHHNQLYFYLLGNGATHAEALDMFVRRALDKAVVPGLSQMSTVVVGTAPVMMWTMLMCGCGALEAAAFQMLVMAAAFCVSVMSVLLAVILTRKYMFDAYSRLKPLRETDSKEAPAVQETTVQETDGSEEEN